jgi:hypothetical protein
MSLSGTEGAGAKPKPIKAAVAKPARRKPSRVRTARDGFVIN